MRILIVTNLYSPLARGGAERIAKITAEEMKRQGHEVVVLSTTDGSKPEDSVVEGVRIIRYQPSLPYYLLQDAKQRFVRRLWWHAKDLFSRQSARVAKRIIDDVRPDLIVSHNLRGMGMSVVRAIRRSGVRWAHVLHDIQLLVPSGQYSYERPCLWQRGFVARPYQWVTRRIMRSPDIVVGPTNYILDVHKQGGFFRKSSLLQLVNPVGIEAEGSRQKAVGVKKRLLYVGQLEKMKGVHVLIAALRKLHDRELRVDIVGEGSYHQELFQLASSLPESIDIAFHGRVPHERVMEMMHAVDGLVLPSVDIENCPGVILEARMTSLATIASNIGGVPELIHPAGLVPPADPKALAQKIFELVEGKIPVTKDFTQPTLEEHVSTLLSR